MQVRCLAPVTDVNAATMGLSHQVQYHLSLSLIYFLSLSTLLFALPLSSLSLSLSLSLSVFYCRTTCAVGVVGMSRPQ